ncbi:MAG: histidine kinase dimerization/phospho-acceptor domain-containing protein [Alphaproteobacteria bacterium]
MGFRAILMLAGIVSALFSGEAAAAGAEARLTAAEKRWIAENPIIRSAPDPNYHPIEALNARGHLQGISTGYIDLLEKKTGLRFKILTPKNWDHALRMVRNREADALSATTATEARMEYLLFTQAHLTLPGVLMVRNSGTPYPDLASLKGKSLGVVSGYVWEEWIARDYPSIKLKPVSNMEAGLLLTSFGELDAMVGNLATATHTLRRLGITNLRVSGETEYAALLAFASRNDWPLLNTVLQKGLSAITEAEHAAILNEHIAFGVEKGLNRRTILLIGISTLGVILMAAATAWLWNKSLRQMVDQQSAELRKSGERYRAIVQDQSELIFRSLPESHVITFVNDAYCVHHGKEQEEMIGRSFLEFVPVGGHGVVKDHLAELSKETPSARAESRWVGPEGEVRWFNWSSRAIFDDAGELTEIQSVGRDVTQQRLDQEALRVAKEEAEVASRAKSEFLANFSHELRTPLNAIIGFSEMISGELLGRINDRRYRDYAANILSSGNHLLGLISDILDVAKIETGQEDFEPTKVDLFEVVDIALVMTRERAKGGAWNLSATCRLVSPCR